MKEKSWMKQAVEAMENVASFRDGCRYGIEACIRKGHEIGRREEYFSAQLYLVLNELEALKEEVG